HLVRHRFADEVAMRDFALVTRRQNEVLAALARVRSRESHVQNPALVMVVGQTDKWTGRELDHVGAVRHVETSGTVGGVGVGRERDLARPGREDDDALVVLDALLAVAVEDALARDAWVPESVGGDGPLIVGLVACFLCLVGRRKPAFEGWLLREG